METRDYKVELRAAEGGDGRTLVGLAVPYNKRTQVGSFFETVLPGAFDGSQHVVLKAEHRTAIGTLKHWDTPDGLMIEARISDTQTGNDAITLIRDGVWDRLSIGFNPTPDGVAFERDGTQTIKKARLIEVSVLGDAAYGEHAKVLSLREAGNEQLNNNSIEKESVMTDEKLKDIEAGLTELRQSNEDLQRRMASMPTFETRNATSTSYRSGGEFILARYRNEDEAVEMSRAWDGTKVAEVAKAVPWLDRAIRIVDTNSVAVNCFRRAPLPASGTGGTFLKMGNSTITVGRQQEEGALLPFGKLDLSTGTANFGTYGGWSSMSFQAIERGEVDVLSMTFDMLAAQAAIRSNKAFVDDLIAANASYLSVAIAPVGTTASAFDAYMDALVDAQLLLNGQGIGLGAQKILVSTDVYRKLLKVKDGDFRLMGIPGVNYGSHSSDAGSAQLPTMLGGGLGGYIAGFPVYVEAYLPANTMWLFNENAATCIGDRVPTRLNDQSITTLTKDVSLYFYQGSAVAFPNALVKLTGIR